MKRLVEWFKFGASAAWVAFSCQHVGFVVTALAVGAGYLGGVLLTRGLGDSR